MKIALANIRFPSSPDESVALACDAIARASAEQAWIVAFPECYVPGYRAPNRFVPPPDQGFLERAWSSIADAARTSNIAVILGTERIVDGEMRITALVINADGTRAGFQDKVQLDPSEEATYAAGNERRVFRAGDLTFGISICHEGWRYPETVRWPARQGAQVVFHPHFHDGEPGAFRPDTFGDPRNSFHEKAMLCRAAENTCYFASINCAVDGSGTTSAVVDPNGSVIAWQPYGKEGLLVVDVDLSKATGLLASRYRVL